MGYALVSVQLTRRQIRGRHFKIMRRSPWLKMPFIYAAVGG
jgi:hypothetical protein